jgi:threonyl-tRNA synthetase
MINITLPDGSLKPMADGATIADLALSIGPGLAKAAVAGRVDGEPRDLSFKLTSPCKVEILTLKNPLGLEILRHSTSHIMAAAVKQLYPKAQVTIGPAIETGFYYDFAMDKALTDDDLAAIEAKMRDMIASNQAFTRSEMGAGEAEALFAGMGESYKAEIIRDLGQATVSLYKVGDFLDLCRGPHLPSSSAVPAFKLLNVAGAYWRGNEKNAMLTRVYGTAFASQKELDEHLKQIEEARKRDHRRLGKELDLFSFHEEGGAGLVYWHPKGAMARKLVEDFWREQHIQAGYQFVISPHIGKAELWQISGHLENYRESMYSPMDIDGQEYFIKPMNCPFHIMIYKTGTRSYRDLPIRYSELGTVYRYERSGALHGMLRVRGFTQDDSHIFVTPEQLRAEIESVLNFMFFFLKTFQFKEFEVFLSTRPKEFVGEIPVWDTATAALREVLDKIGIKYGIDEGGGAFYGPKIDIKVKDSIGRSWQVSTLQVDFNLPQRFDMQYVAEDGTRKQPIMLHRALLGSLERFFAVLVEHFAGAFPVWMAPIQARILTITNAVDPYAQGLLAELRAKGLRVEADFSPEKINAKVRDAQMAKIPYSLVVGAKEAEGGKVAVRRYASQDTQVMSKEDFVAQVLADVQERR